MSDNSIAYGFNRTHEAISSVVQGMYSRCAVDVVPEISRFIQKNVVEPTKKVGSFVGRIARPVALGLSRLSTSVTGLSDLLKAAIMSDALFRAVRSHNDHERAICRRFNEYRTVADATRILDAPSYYLGDDMGEDIKDARWYSVASSVLGTAISVLGFGCFIFDQEIKPCIQGDMSKERSFAHARGIIDKGIGIACIGSSSLAAVESVRDIVRGKTSSIPYSLWRLGASATDVIHTALDMMPSVGLPALTASMGLISASCGIVSFFLDPKA